MKFLFGCLFLFFLTGLYANLYAQATATSLSGKVLTADHSPAAASTIILLKYKDSTIVSNTITDNAGLFRFAGIQPGTYLVLVSAVGYDKLYAGPFTVTGGNPVKAPDISLNASSKLLKEVSIVASKPEIEASPGKITINVQNSILAAGNSAFDILRQSPGVRVDGNNISIVGRQSALILINGKPTNLTGEDLAGILKGMQANTIDHIELITGGSAKYDASGGGIINIILKKGKNTGAYGSVTATAGYGKYYKGGTGIVFNNRTDKFNVFGSYNYSANKTFHDFTNDRIINFNNTTSQYNTSYNNVENNYVNAFGLGTDFYISGNQTIGFLVNGLVTDNHFVKGNNLQISNQSVLDSIITANAGVNRHVSHINYNLNYSGKLDKAGKTLSADVNYTTFNRSSAENIINNFYNSAGIYYRDSLLRNLSPSNVRIWSSQVDFTDPLSKASKLEAGVKYSNVNSNNDLVLESLVHAQYQSDPHFTNHFIYTENVNAGYVSYDNAFSKFDLVTSLRVEQTIAKGNSLTLGRIVNSNYTDLFPTVSFTYHNDDKHIFSLSYNRGILRPKYEQLNPFLYYIDLYDFTAGNPNLKPQYTNSVELSYNYNKTFLATLYSTIVSNAFQFPFYEQNDTSKVNINTRVNFGTVYSYGIRFFVPVAFTNWWNIDFHLDAAYQRYVAYPVYGDLNKGTQDINIDINQHFTISKTISADILSHYESPSFYGVNQFKAYYNVDAGISQQLFNKKGSLQLSAGDIFNTLRDRTYTNYQNLNLTGTDKIETQVVRLTFTYRFGKNSAKSRLHDTGNEDEQNRTKAVN